MKKDKVVERLTRMGFLTALALIIFFVEAQIPPLVPIAGVKLGLANIITVYAMFGLGPRDTFCILLCRIFLGSIFVGNAMTIFYSLAGGIMCYLVMYIMRKIVTRQQIWVCSVLGAIAHNIGQVVVAVIIADTTQLFLYLPVLVSSGILAGLFTGLCAQFIVKRMKHIS